MPGSFKKSVSVTEPMARISPKCSMAGAIATGSMKNIADQFHSGKNEGGHGEPGGLLITGGEIDQTPMPRATR